MYVKDTTEEDTRRDCVEQDCSILSTTVAEAGRLIQGKFCRNVLVLLWWQQVVKTGCLVQHVSGKETPSEFFTTTAERVDTSYS